MSSMTIRYKNGVIYSLCTVSLWCQHYIDERLHTDSVQIYNGEGEAIEAGWVKLVSKDKGVHWICDKCYKECIGD